MRSSRIAAHQIRRYVRGGHAARAKIDAAIGEPHAPARLPASLQGRMERVFGRPFDDVELHRDSGEVPAGQRAIAVGRHIHFERGGVDLTTARGELVLAHELAHVVQQDSLGERAGTRQEIEREAARAAARAAWEGGGGTRPARSPSALNGLSDPRARVGAWTALPCL